MLTLTSRLTLSATRYWQSPCQLRAPAFSSRRVGPASTTASRKPQRCWLLPAPVRMGYSERVEWHVSPITVGRGSLPLPPQRGDRGLPRSSRAMTPGGCSVSPPLASSSSSTRWSTPVASSACSASVTASPPWKESVRVIPLASFGIGGGPRAGTGAAAASAGGFSPPAAAGGMGVAAALSAMLLLRRDLEEEEEDLVLGLDLDSALSFDFSFFGLASVATWM